MTAHSTHLFTGALLFVSMATTMPAIPKESEALLGVLLRKGILTNQEADDIRANLAQEGDAITPEPVIAGGKSTERLSLGMRMQLQYANIGAEVDAFEIKPAPTHHAFLRRIYVTVKAEVGKNWGATMTYDLASGSYDDAILEWKPTSDHSFNFGLRKVNVVHEERASSGDLKSIERSGVTRYFVESNDGRQLGAASYRIGAFFDGKEKIGSDTSVIYGAAITNPERNESFTLSSGTGDATNNTPAYWGNVALSGKLPLNGTWVAGIGAGFLPDQGGVGTTNLGRGFDLSIYSAFVDVEAGRVRFSGEYLVADVERGSSAIRDARPDGFYLQPSFLITETIEAVARYQYLDTDRRGVTLADVVRSAPATATMNTFSEWYAGANWYLRGDDLKIQLGGMYAKTRDTVTGEPAKAKALGVRSQLQIQF